MHDREKMKDKTSTTLIAIGTGLIGIQMVKHLLDLLLHTVFRTERMLSTRELEKLGKLERYETLGNLLKQLRTKVELHPDLELYLQEFLEDRNRFVHGLIETPSFNLSEGEGQQRCLRICRKMTTSRARLTKLFLAVLSQFKDPRAPNAPLDDDLRMLFEGAEEWKSSVERLFRTRA
jgi:hypothetical protein